MLISGALQSFLNLIKGTKLYEILNQVKVCNNDFEVPTSEYIPTASAVSDNPNKANLMGCQ